LIAGVTAAEAADRQKDLPVDRHLYIAYLGMQGDASHPGDHPIVGLDQIGLFPARLHSA
jgi:hypothetical protein